MCWAFCFHLIVFCCFQASRTALHELCRSNSAEEDKLATLAELLIEYGCQLDAKCSDLGEADFTPLMFCAYHNHPKVAEKLISAGCQINAQGSVSSSRPIHLFWVRCGFDKLGHCMALYPAQFVLSNPFLSLNVFFVFSFCVCSLRMVGQLYIGHQTETTQLLLKFCLITG